MSIKNGRVEEFTCPLFGYSSDCTAIKELKAEVVEVFEWLVIDSKYRFDDQRQNLEPGSQGGYSPELTKAIALLEKLKDGKEADTEAD